MFTALIAVNNKLFDSGMFAKDCFYREKVKQHVDLKVYCT